jgi:hypothetical protein
MQVAFVIYFCSVDFLHHMNEVGYHKQKISRTKFSFELQEYNYLDIINDSVHIPSNILC